MRVKTLLVSFFFIIGGTTGLLASTWYVSVEGSDQFPGNREQPYRSISRGAAMAMPGDTVFVLEGVYRERVAPPRGGTAGKPIVYMGEPGKQVFIKGSEVWEPEWVRAESGAWYAVPQEYLFTDRSSEYVDDYHPFRTELASTPHERQGKYELMRGWEGDSTLVYTCGQVIIDDKMYTEVPFKGELAPGMWYFEKKSGRIYVHFGTTKPESHMVEITTRRRIFAPYQRGLGYITVEGFILEHAGTNYPTNFWAEDQWAQKGAMGIEAGHHWVIRRNVIRRAKTFALDCGKVDKNTAPGITAHDNIIEENYILENGAAGIMSSSSLNMVIRGNVILYNNTLGFLGMKRWEQAGIKCHNPKNALVYENYIAHNYKTFGIWFDNQFPDARIFRNFLAYNGRQGIFLEMSDYEYDRCFIDHNIIIGNANNPVYIHDASGATFLNNIMANTREQPEFGQAVMIRQADARTRSYHHSFYNNLFFDNARIYNINYPSFRGGAQKMDYNVYETGIRDRDFCINKNSDGPSPYTDDEFIKLIAEDLGPMAPAEKKMAGASFIELRDTMCALHRNPEAEMNTSRGLVHLTFTEWKAFWEAHGEKNDGNSILSKGNSISYNPKNHELEIHIAFDPTSVGSYVHPFTDQDYENIKVPGDGSAVPGPFQNLKKGNNKFIAWEGLEILERGSLPDPKDFKSKNQ